MPDSLQAFIIIFLIGVLLRSSSLLTKAHANRLARFVFCVSLPATIMISLDRIPFTAAIWKLPAAACLVTLPLLLISWVIARLLDLPRPTQGGFLLATGLINSLYFSYPVILATFGEAGLAHAMMFDLGQTVLTLTVLYGLALRHGTSSSPARPFAVRFLSAPPLWGLCGILALKAGGLGLPVWLHGVLAPIHWTTTPLASLVLGLSISVATVGRNVGLAILGVAVRMGGGLLLGLAAAWLLHLEGLQRTVVILVAAMPSAVNAVIYAAEAELDEEIVTSVVALSILLGIVLLPFLPRLAQYLVT
ncbi:MAG: AEC family transporter [Nitrospira sp.]